MLWKLSMTGIKSRFKDYLVLFSGLTLAGAIFYMFMTLATNGDFLNDSLPVTSQTIRLAFGIGIVLLILITFIYIVYANSFLLSMRKKDYGMYMILGARTSKIGKLIFVETLLVGLLATLVGILIGIVLAQWVSSVLVSQLGLTLHKFIGFYLPALLWTLVFFTLIFFLAAFWNRRRLVKSKVIDLLHEDQKPIRLHHHPVLKNIEALAGIVLMAGGYWVMTQAMVFKANTIWIAFLTIVIGTFFVFDALFTGVINILSKNRHFKYHKLRSFTIGQLKFRLGDYTRILTVISLLFALALGAITVGLDFVHVTDISLQANYYDVQLYQDTPAVRKQLKKVSVREQTGFDYKQVKNKIYVSKEQLLNNQIKSQEFRIKNGQTEYYTITIKPEELVKNKLPDNASLNGLLALLPMGDNDVKVINQDKFNQLKAQNNHVSLLLVNNFKQNIKNIESLQRAGLPNKPSYELLRTGVKVRQFIEINAIAAGFEFMGFFLGIAFLAMLA
ncbi:putative ABC transport system permease protein [Lactobacillus colini]|uniref:ABC transport system permease protein n=1 Tax=Lactobacillus colini TaxID=1819254 RepID=A0ABS4MEK7_9LACO|nr:putative ABC transport system permease protein [Lactobacillus colini]